MPSASTFTRGDINPAAGRNTAEAANQGAAAMNIALPNNGGDMLGGANNAAPVSGSPVMVVVSILVVLLALRFFKHRAGEDDRGVAPTFYNIMVITLSAMLGGLLLKTMALKFLPSNNALRAVVMSG